MTPFYPWALALFPLLALFVHNSHSAGLRDLWPPLLVVLVVTTAIFLVSLRRLKDQHTAALVTAVIGVGAMVYGHVYNAVTFAGVHNLFLSHLFNLSHRNPGLLLVYTAALVLLCWAVIKKIKPGAAWTQALNVVAAVALAMVLLNAGAGGAVAIGAEVADLQEAVGIGTVEETPAVKRDIYLIVLDAYGGEPGLQEAFGFDNSGFTRDLLARDFQVAVNSTSNYFLTDLSLPTTLNMDYLQEYAPDVGGLPLDWPAKLEITRYGAVAQFLDDQGYHLRSINSEWAPTSTNPWADENIYCGSFNEFQLTVMKTTMMRFVAPWIAGEDKRDRVECQFDALAAPPDSDAPTFTVAHLLMPHSPIVFKADGSPYSDPSAAELNAGWAREPFLGQLQYTSKRTLETVDGILDDYRDRPHPIIIIQGDHGTAVAFEEIEGVDGLRGLPDPDALEDASYRAAMRERSSILNAYYLPGVDGVIYDSMTPVNTFRIVLDHYFGTDMGLLPDQNYFSTYADMYTLYNVTEQVARH